MPIFHGQYLENSYESYRERIVVASRQLLDVVAKLTAEDLGSKKRENDDEEKHEHGDVEERHV